MSARLALLAWLWQGQWRAGRGRAATAVVAIAVGVALGLAIHLVNRSALGEFGAAIAVVNGDAQAQVVSGSGSMDEALFERIATDSRVIAASPVVEADVQWFAAETAQHAGARASSLRVIGLDAMRAAAVTPALLPVPASDAGGSSSDLFASDAIFLSRAASQALDARAGNDVTLRTGVHTLALRMAGTMPGAAAGQRLAVMDLGTAQWRLGWLGRLSRIDLRLADGVSAQTLAADWAGRLPAGVSIVAADAAQQRMSNLSRAYRVNLNVLAMVALLTGGFIVYATLSLSVVRQQPELALLGVLGASGRLLGAVVLGQGAVLGVVGALLGAGLGIGMAWGVLAVVGGDLGGGFFLGSAPPLVVDALSVTAFGAMGVGVGLAGSLVPALALRQLAPARALKAGAAELALRRGHSLAWTLALIALGLALLAAPPVEGLPVAAYGAITAWLFAGIAFVPLLVRGLGAALAAVMPRAWRKPAAWLALSRIRGTPGGSAAALAGVVASFALSSAMAIMVHSFRESVTHWLDEVLPADLYARTPSAGARGALEASLQGALARVPGVARAEFTRATDLSLSPSRPPVTLLSRPLEAASADRRLPLTGMMLPAPPGTVPVWVSEAMVDLYGFAPGKMVSLPVPGGARFFVSGVWRDYSRQHGTVVIAESDFRRLTGDDSASDIALWLAPGANEAGVMAAVRASDPGLADLELRSAREIRAISLRIFDRSFALTYVLEAIAIVVGLFGVASTYAGEALARAREFGMLRHLGVTRAQIGAMFAIESGALITAGVTWGACVGAAISLVLVHRVNPQSFHWTMNVAWPTGLLAATAAGLTLLGVAAAVIASRSATGNSPVRAVRQDW